MSAIFRVKFACSSCVSMVFISVPLWGGAVIDALLFAIITVHDGRGIAKPRPIPPRIPMRPR